MIIQELTLFTSQLEKQKVFYHNTLGLHLIDEKDDSFKIKIGGSYLNFQYKKETTPYHFALNIPANKGLEALSWLKARVSIQKLAGEELVDFKDWNAKSIYFYDEDKNIVELISRKNLGWFTHQSFDQKQVMSISEIGIATSSVMTIYTYLNHVFGLDIYDGSPNRFCAIGNEQGMFIVINNQVKGWIPNNDKAFSSPFMVSIKTPKGKFSFQFEKEEISLSVN